MVLGSWGTVGSFSELKGFNAPLGHLESTGPVRHWAVAFAEGAVGVQSLGVS